MPLERFLHRVMHVRFECFSSIIKHILNALDSRQKANWLTKALTNVLTDILADQQTGWRMR